MQLKPFKRPSLDAALLPVILGYGLVGDSRDATTLDSGPCPVLHACAGRCGGCDELAAHRAASLLVAPEVKRLPIAPELGRHLSTQTGGKVVLPGRIIGIGLPSDFHIPPNWRCRHFHQAGF